MTTEARTYSSPAVEQRVTAVLGEIRQVVDTTRPWSEPISDRQVNANIPGLVRLSNQLKNALYETPSHLEIQYQIKPGFLYFPPTEPSQQPSETVYVVKEPVQYQEPLQDSNIIRATSWSELHKNALPDEVFYRRLMDQATWVMQLFAGKTYFSPPAEIDPQTLSYAKLGVEQRQADYMLATQAASEAVGYVSSTWRPVLSQFRTLALGAAGYEAVSYGNNWNRMLLGFYLKGMFDVEFQRFEPLGEKGRARVGLRAHFLGEDGRIGCWADWEEKVRAFHEPDESYCSSYTSYALRLGDKIRLSLRPYPDGDDFNHRPIDRTQ